jgi:hypothetical protein
LTFEKAIFYNNYKLLAGEGSSLAPLPFPFSNLGASPASALTFFVTLPPVPVTTAVDIRSPSAGHRENEFGCLNSFSGSRMPLILKRVHRMERI